MAKSNKEVFLGTGRRKSSIARVRLTEGKGNITVNGKKLDEYFGEETLRVIVKQPLVATNTETKYDVIAKVVGGGFSGQAGAVRHGIARALNEANREEYRPKKLVKHHNSQRDNNKKVNDKNVNKKSFKKNLQANCRFFFLLFFI